MTDAVSTIDSAALGTPGMLELRVHPAQLEPFIRDVFDQFSETRTGGAFTFMTGIGGFLQEFLYGYSGMRWNGSAVQLSPSLTSQIGGLVLNDLNWRGRRLHGLDRPAAHDGHAQRRPGDAGQRPRPRTLRAGHALMIHTRRPDLTNTAMWSAAASFREQSQPGAPPLAAVDGSPATDWQPTSVPATLTLRWRRAAVAQPRCGGDASGPAPAPNVPPPPGPVIVLRPPATRFRCRERTHVADGGEHSRPLRRARQRAPARGQGPLRPDPRDRSRRDQAPAARRAHG